MAKAKNKKVVETVAPTQAEVTADTSPAVLSESKTFYIDHFRESKNPEEMAKELSVPVELVTAYMDSRPPKKVVKKDFFQRRDGTVAMTAAQSAADAPNRNKSSPKTSPRLKNCIHVIE